MIKVIFTAVLVFFLSLSSFYILILVVSRSGKSIRLRKNKIKYSITFSICITILSVLIPPISDNNTATIESNRDQFIIKLNSKRSGSKDDPKSIIKQPYDESLILTLPKKSGIIDAQEFIVESPEDSTSLTGRLIVGPWKVTVDLYHQGRPTRWNANYRIVDQKFSPSVDDLSLQEIENKIKGSWRIAEIETKERKWTPHSSDYTVEYFEFNKLKGVNGKIIYNKDGSESYPKSCHD